MTQSFGIDWLSFTVPNFDYTTRLDMFEALGLPSVYTPNDHGFMGWRVSAYPLDGVVYAWGGQSDTFHCSISSSGLRSLYQLAYTSGDVDDFEHFSAELLRRVLGCGARVVRLDLFLDDIGTGDDDYYLVMPSVAAAIRDRRYSSPSSSWSLIESSDGVTYSIGKRSSQRYLRIYDKRAEQLAAGFEGDLPDHWIRVELEIKQDYAMRSAFVILDQGLSRSVIAGLVASFVRFTSWADPEHIERVPTVPWWEDFLAAVPVVVPSLPSSVESGIDSRVSWLFSVSRCVVLAVLARGYGFFDEVMSEGAMRVSAADLQSVQLYLDLNPHLLD